MAHLFISYSRLDSAFTHKLNADLKNAGVATWLDVEQIAAGYDWRRSVEEGINSCGAMLAILSPNYVKSEFARRELATIDDLNLSGEADQQRPVFPILLSSVPEAERPIELRRLQYVPFCAHQPVWQDWRDEPFYQQQLAILLSHINTRSGSLVGAVPDPEMRYVNRLIAELEAYQGVLEYVGLPMQVEPEANAPPPAGKILAPGLALLALSQGEYNREIAQLEDLSAILDLYPRAVIVGSPGAGKTTILRRLALDAARTFLANPRTAPLPLYVRLPQWDQPISAQDFLQAQWLAKELPESADPIELLAAGQVVLFLDGLNEMGRNSAVNAEALRNWLNDTSRNAPKRVIVTCRRADYAGPLNLNIPATVLIKDMDAPRIKAFIASYLPPHAAAALTRRILPEDERLWKHRSSLFQLAQNPYMLAALIAVHQYAPDGELPRNHGALFQALARVLWERERVAHSPGWIPFENAELRFAKLAYAMLDEDKSVAVSQSYALEKLGSSDLLKAGRSASFLQLSGERVQFYHQLMQEYFAAIALSSIDPQTVLQPPQFSSTGLQRLATNRDQALIALCGITSDVEGTIRRIMQLDPFLAIQCITSGVAHSPRLRTEILDQLQRRLEEQYPVPETIGAALVLWQLDAALAMPGLVKRLSDIRGWPGKRVCDYALAILKQIDTAPARKAVAGWQVNPVFECPACGNSLDFYVRSWCDGYHPDGDWYETVELTCGRCHLIGKEKMYHCSEFASDEWHEEQREPFSTGSYAFWASLGTVSQHTVEDAAHRFEPIPLWPGTDGT